MGLPYSKYPVWLNEMEDSWRISHQRLSIDYDVRKTSNIPYRVL